MSGIEQPRKRRRAVGPPGSRPAQDEPLPETRERQPDDLSDLDRYEAERPPHHEPR